MTITNELFEAFLRCPTKCFLRANGALPSGNVYAEWVRREVESYRMKAAGYLMKRLSPIGALRGLLDSSDLVSATWRCVLDSTVRSRNLEAQVDAIERMQSSAQNLSLQFVPIRFVRANRLVHFVRDLDDDVLKNPLDEEQKTIAQEFGDVLKPIIQSVDRFGLKKRHLQKHKRSVIRFLRSVHLRDLVSPVAKAIKERFEKTGAKMFTFLDCDGIPWNNNYAEHAIKRFAKYRRLFDGLYTEDSLNEYLILASVLTTCEYNNINLLKFLLSGEQSLGDLFRMGRPKSRKFTALPELSQNAEIVELQQAGYLGSLMGVSPDRMAVRVNCTDSNWKERCKTLLKGLQEIELVDFDADANRDWAHSLARRHGARCQVRKRIGQVVFTFARAPRHQ